MCLALLKKLDRGTPKYKMAEVRYLIYVLLRELMRTPIVGFELANKKSVDKRKRMQIKDSVKSNATTTTIKSPGILAGSAASRENTLEGD